jgi:hypothetical protein
MVADVIYQAATDGSAQLSILSVKMQGVCQIKEQEISLY